MNFIKNILDKKTGEDEHLQFQKFSRGEFKDRALVKIKNSSGKYTISTTAEFANGLVKLVAEKVGAQKTKVTGGIISTVNLKEIPEYKQLLEKSTVKQFQGVKNYAVDLEISGKEILDMVKTFPKAFFGLSFEAPGYALKIKAKAPKSAKPKNKDEAPNPDFCKLVTNDKELAKSFCWEKPEFKSAEITHEFIIQEIIIPEEFKKEKDFAVIREKSIRKGKIIRKAVVDEQEFNQIIDFEV